MSREKHRYSGQSFYPAEGAIALQLVDCEEPAPANSILQGVAQPGSFFGPTLAGLVIAFFAGAGQAAGLVVIRHQMQV